MDESPRESDAVTSVLRYRVWPLVEWKTTSFFFLAVLSLLTYTVWLSLDDWRVALAVPLLLLVSIRSSLFPQSFELNVDGVTRWRLGARQFLAWSDIHSYDVLDHGIILLPQGDRYVLAPFRGRFIPVPKALLKEVEAKFRFFANR